MAHKKAKTLENRVKYMLSEKCNSEHSKLIFDLFRLGVYPFSGHFTGCWLALSSKISYYLLQKFAQVFHIGV